MPSRNGGPGQILGRDEIRTLLASSDEDSLFLDPLLDPEQVGAVTVDLRLGYDFLVSVLTRRPYIAIYQDEDYRSTASYFQSTRRELGDRFILYPGQVVLTTTLEYVSLPSTVYADIISRSSYNRLGIAINTMLQPGFRGCAPIELFNHGNNAIELVVGSRMFQARLFRTASQAHYLDGSPRKYYGDVRPTASRASQDADLVRLRGG
jgi:dCTP deaminase